MHTHLLEQQINPLQQPAKELMNLNLKALQQIKFPNPVELMSIKKPEEILEKNMELFIENGHHALDYVYSVFHIMEKNWFKLSNNLMEESQVHMDHTQKSIRTNVNEIVNATNRTVKQAASTSRKTVSAKRPSRSASAKSAKTTPARVSTANASAKSAKATSARASTKSAKRTPVRVHAVSASAKSAKATPARARVGSTGTKSAKRTPVRVHTASASAKSAKATPARARAASTGTKSAKITPVRVHTASASAKSSKRTPARVHTSKKSISHLAAADRKTTPVAKAQSTSL